jgi:hypothetical protein
MKKRLLGILVLCIILDWYIKNNVVQQKSDNKQVAVSQKAVKKS